MQLMYDPNDPSHATRILTTSIDHFAEIAKALSSDLRIAMFKELLKGSRNVAEMAEMFGIPASTAAVNIRKLEEAGLIRTEFIPGTRGTQKSCAALYSRIVVDMAERIEPSENHVLIPMPIGHFFESSIVPTCGIVGESSMIGEIDDPRSFFEPARIDAQLIWFRRGYLEYRFPNRIPHGSAAKNLELSMEICSEAPLYNTDWPSDITLWINGVEVGTWTSPGDFGGERGLLTPEWWGTQNTQFGLLKTWRVTDKGSFMDGRQISAVELERLKVDDSPFITVRVGIKPDAKNDGGINLFGRKFGNYETDLVLRLDYVTKEPKSV